MIKEKIIQYIENNRVSTTEIADCLGKANGGMDETIQTINRGHFAVGEVKYLFAVNDSNWFIHKDLEKLEERGYILFFDAINIHDRAVVGDLVSKYSLLYKGGKAIVCAGKMRDAHRLIKENYPIWCTGVSPIGCFNSEPDISDCQDTIREHYEKYEGSIMVCDDSGVVLISKDKITEEFYQALVDIETQEDIWYDCVDRRKWSTFRTVCKKDYKNTKE